MDPTLGFLCAVCFIGFIVQISYGYLAKQNAELQAGILFEIRDLIAQRTKDEDLFAWTRGMFDKLVEANTVERLGRDVVPYVQQKRMEKIPIKPPAPSPNVKGSWAPPGSTILKTEG